MKALPTWAPMAAVCFDANFGYSIETISVNEQSCTLSGAWNFDSLEDPNLSNIMQGRLLIVSGMLDSQHLSSKFVANVVDLNLFITDAAESAKDGLEKFNNYLEKNAKQYSEYMAIPPFERKLLPKVVRKKLEPIYAHSWKISFDELKPEMMLRQLGKRENIEGTPPNMKRLISTSWAIKHLVDRWREDEFQRRSRDYLYAEDNQFQILPNSWMKSLGELQEISRK